MSKNKIAIVFSVFLMFAMMTSLLALPANAHDPPWTIPTYAFIEVTPNPIGVGQDAFIIMWLDKVPPTAGGAGGDRWQNFRVTVTAPNGDTESLGPYNSDPVGSAYVGFTPDQVGEYTFEFTYPGQVASLYNPETGVEGQPSVYLGDQYQGSSAEATLTVQEDPVTEPPTYPLPSRYWTRPIEGENTEWAKVSSNWLGGTATIFGDYIEQGYQPNGVAPGSPHIMWTKPLEFGGVVGGTEDYAAASAMTYYGGLSYESRWANPLIINGRLYYDTPLSDVPNGGPYVCVDLRTGETLWENQDISPSFAQLYDYESPNQHGVIPSGYLWTTSGFGTQTWTAYDPLTGAYLFTLTDVPSGTTHYTDNGEIVRYVFNSENNWMALWNNTAAPDMLLGTTGTNAWQYRPVGKTINASTAYSWNATLNFDLPDGFTVRFVSPDDVLIGSVGTFGSLFDFGTPDPYTLWAIDLQPNTRGRLLWTEDYTMPSGNLTRFFESMDIESRVFTVYDREVMAWRGYSMDDGSLVWGPNSYSHNAFSYYGSGGTSSQEFGVAYGNMYWTTNGGELFCVEMATGNLLWTYDNTYSAHETPWGHYPLTLATIADGKVYVYTSEHSPNVPPYKSSRIRCINATTGEEIWTMLSWALSRWSDYLPIADGYLSYLNMYDGQVYSIGKGPSSTTVQIQNDVITNGNSVLVKGTVTDQSEGAKHKVQSGEFTMVPAVSDDSMGPWMEYIYMQKPCPAEVNGVEVTISVFDPNGNTYDVGTATSDANGIYGLSFTPPVPGKYTVIATFKGSASYWSSYAATVLMVESPAPTTEPTATAASMTDTYVIGLGAGAIIAIIAIGLVLILMLRKR